MNQITSTHGASSAPVKPETRGNVGFPRVIVRSGASGRPTLRLATTESLIPDRGYHGHPRYDATQRKSQRSTVISFWTEKREGADFSRAAALRKRAASTFPYEPWLARALTGVRVHLRFQLRGSWHWRTKPAPPSTGFPRFQVPRF